MKVSRKLVIAKDWTVSDINRKCSLGIKVTIPSRPLVNKYVFFVLSWGTLYVSLTNPSASLMELQEIPFFFLDVLMFYQSISQTKRTDL